MPEKTTRKRATWSQFIPDDEWACYQSAIEVVRQANAKFLIGGAFGLAVYTGRWRNTKDLDLVILPRDLDAIIHALTESGFKDYYEQVPYDRGWIYRSTRDGFIVDVIFAMANRRAEVDEEWFERAPTISIRNEKLLVVPPEELLWHKLYVLQRERCDWPDIMNLLYENGPTLDWEHLLRRLGNDAQLLQAVLLVFDWICPQVSHEFPEWLRQRLHLPPSQADENVDWKKNISLLDSRQWFAGLEPDKKKLEN
ncbi:MAG: nucleotidyltransferase family protein [Verrucomicrobiota bacterium]